MTTDLDFRRVYARHRPQVKRHLKRLGVPPGVQRDVQQDVWLEVWRCLHTFKGKSTFGHWLYGLTENVVRRSRRDYARSRLDMQASLPDVVDEGPSPEEPSQARERHERLEELLKQLAPKKRAVLELHDLQGLHAARIAEMVGAPILTVRTRLFYARQDIEALARGEPALAEYFTPEAAA